MGPNERVDTNKRVDTSEPQVTSSGPTASPLTLVDRDNSVGPVVTPDPAPSDDMLFKLAGAAACGAVVGSFVAYRWLRRHVDVRL